MSDDPLDPSSRGSATVPLSMTSIRPSRSSAPPKSFNPPVAVRQHDRSDPILRRGTGREGAPDSSSQLWGVALEAPTLGALLERLMTYLKGNLDLLKRFLGEAS